MPINEEELFNVETFYEESKNYRRILRDSKADIGDVIYVTSETKTHVIIPYLNAISKFYSNMDHIAHIMSTDRTSQAIPEVRRNFMITNVNRDRECYKYPTLGDIDELVMLAREVIRTYNIVMRLEYVCYTNVILKVLSSFIRIDMRTRYQKLALRIMNQEVIQYNAKVLAKDFINCCDVYVASIYNYVDIQSKKCYNHIKKLNIMNGISYFCRMQQPSKKDNSFSLMYKDYKNKIVAHIRILFDYTLINSQLTVPIVIKDMLFKNNSENISHNYVSIGDSIYANIAWFYSDIEKIVVGVKAFDQRFLEEKRQKQLESDLKEIVNDTPQSSIIPFSRTIEIPHPLILRQASDVTP